MSTAKTMYASLGRLAYKAMYPILRLYTTDRHHRVRVLLRNEQNEILLVRSWLGAQHWSMPGGGIRRSETPLAAAVREVQEETGLTLTPEQLSELGKFVHPDPTFAFTVVCFTAQVPRVEPRTVRHRRLEVLDSAWFPLHGLPRRYSQAVDTALGLLTAAR